MQEDWSYYLHHGTSELRQSWVDGGRRWRPYGGRRCRHRRSTRKTIEGGGRRKSSPAARILRVHDSVGFAIVVALAPAGTVGNGRTAVFWICFVEAGRSGLSFDVEGIIK